MIKEHELVLRQVPPESREAVISAMAHLREAFKERMRQLPCCVDDTDCG